MNIEYEATFKNIDRDEMRKKLRSAGATLIKPHFMQKRTVFELPSGHEIPGGWLRVRNEGDRVTMALKVVTNNAHIEDQKETEITVNDYNEAVTLLKTIGCREKAYQESYRELWTLNDVEITIDEWPYLEPFVEIEAKSEDAVRDAAAKLGFNYRKAYFGSVDGLYADKYHIPEEQINLRTPEILFDMPENPFL